MRPGETAPIAGYDRHLRRLRPSARVRTTREPRVASRSAGRPRRAVGDAVETPVLRARTCRPPRRHPTFGSRSSTSRSATSIERRHGGRAHLLEAAGDADLARPGDDGAGRHRLAQRPAAARRRRPRARRRGAAAGCGLMSAGHARRGGLRAGRAALLPRACRRRSPCSPTRCSTTRRSKRGRGRLSASCAAWSARTSRSTIPTPRWPRPAVLVRERLVAGDSDARCSTTSSSATASSCAGSGFFISADGYVVTNNHVVDKADRGPPSCSMTAPTLEAKVVGVDPKTDLALLKIDGGPRPSLRQVRRDQAPRRRLGRRRRQPVRPRRHRDRRHRLGPRPRHRRRPL
jgi:hypothetical protein